MQIETLDITKSDLVVTYVKTLAKGRFKRGVRESPRSNPCAKKADMSASPYETAFTLVSEQR